MSDFQINIPGGQSKRLLTGGKYCPADIVVTAEGGAASVSVSPKEVNFCDYDGTCLYAYTVEEAQALTELPPLPERDGLICQGWNWTLEGVNGLDRPMDVGATYITDDGATRLKIRITAKERMDVPLYFYQNVDGGVVIDWGDGTSETVSGTGYINTTHTYSVVGDYTISLMPDDGCTLDLGSNASSACVFGASLTMRAYSSMLREVNIGNNVTSLSAYAFYSCENLFVCTIPQGVSTIGNGVFYSTALRFLVLPYGCTNVGGNECYRETKIESISVAETATGTTSTGVFRYCGGLHQPTLPDGITSLSVNFCAECRALTSFVVPSAVANIYATAFSNAYSLKLLDCTRCTAVPTLANVNAFQNVPADFEIRVPSSLYGEWIAATNWATYASQIVGV